MFAEEKIKGLSDSHQMLGGGGQSKSGYQSTSLAPGSVGTVNTSVVQHCGNLMSILALVLPGRLC